MADEVDHRQAEPEDPALALAARHALHDEELVAAFATDGDAAEEAERAKALVERCATCRELHVDLVAIGGGLRAFESAAVVAASERAPRDFRLSVETANRLRPGSVVLRLRDRIREAIASFSRPVGMSMASLGIVGLVLGTLTLGGLGGAGAATENVGMSGSDSTAAPGGAATLDTGGQMGPAGTPGETVRTASFRTESPAAPASIPPATSPPATFAVDGGPVPDTFSGGGSTLPILLVAGSAVLLIGGIALFVLGSRRREPFPRP